MESFTSSLWSLLAWSCLWAPDHWAVWSILNLHYLIAEDGTALATPRTAPASATEVSPGPCRSPRDRGCGKEVASLKS